jgi:hypothetical protein
MGNFIYSVAAMGCPGMGEGRVWRVKVAFRCLCRILIIMSGLRCSLTWDSRLGTTSHAVASMKISF